MCYSHSKIQNLKETELLFLPPNATSKLQSCDQEPVGRHPWMAIFQKTMRKHIFLHPMDKNRQYFAVKSALLQDKKKYSDKLKGALLDVNNLKVVGDRHLVVNGYLSMDVIADFHVFSPRHGQTLEGVINKRSRSHLGCLVLDTFNASLAIPSSSEFDPQVGDSCTFLVTEVVVDGEIMFLRGSITSVTSNQADCESIQDTEDKSQEEYEASDFKEPKVKKRPSEEMHNPEDKSQEEYEASDFKEPKVKKRPSEEMHNTEDKSQEEDEASDFKEPKVSKKRSAEEMHNPEENHDHVRKKRLISPSKIKKEI